MRSELSPWEKGLLCSLWHRVELDLMDNPEKTPGRLLQLVKRKTEEMQWECRRSISPGQGASGPYSNFQGRPRAVDNGYLEPVDD